MIKIPDNSKGLVYFDVDDTLVIWGKNDPDNSMTFICHGCVESLVPNTEIIMELKKAKKEGSTVVVWSQGGADWVEEVVITLKLEQYVDLIISKPDAYFDDLPAARFMRNWRKA